MAVVALGFSMQVSFVCRWRLARLTCDTAPVLFRLSPLVIVVILLLSSSSSYNHKNVSTHYAPFHICFSTPRR